MHYYATLDEDGQPCELFRRPRSEGVLERWLPKVGEWETLDLDTALGPLEFVHARDFTGVRTQVLKSWYSSRPPAGPIS